MEQSRSFVGNSVPPCGHVMQAGHVRMNRVTFVMFLSHKKSHMINKVFESYTRSVFALVLFTHSLVYVGDFKRTINTFSESLSFGRFFFFIIIILNEK